jgi:hypothetical protein
MDPTPVTPVSPASPAPEPIKFRRLVVFTSLAGNPEPKAA